MNDNDTDDIAIHRDYQVTNEFTPEDYQETCENTNLEITSLCNSNDHDINNNNDITEAQSSIAPKSNCYYGEPENSSSQCIICNQKVYPMEKMNADGKIYHKNCFRCSKCRTFLAVTNFCVSNNILYCKIHFMERFKMRGKYDDDQEVQAQISSGDSESDDPVPEDPTSVDTKSLLAKFRELETGDSSPQRQTSPAPRAVYQQRYTQPTDEVVRSEDLPIDELPPPETAKSRIAQFKAMESGKNVPSPDTSRRIQELARVPAASCGNVRLQRGPSTSLIIASSDVNKKEQAAEMPESGITRSLRFRFEQDE